MGELVTVLVLIAVFIWVCWWSTTDAGKKSQREYEVARAQKTGAPAGVRCPTCKSGTVERVKISTRAVSGVAGGLVFSKKARAQFHCKSCNYYW